MTDQPVTGRPPAAPAPRAQTLAAQSLVNRIIRGLLRTPLVSRLIGSRLVTVYVVGLGEGAEHPVGDRPQVGAVRLEPLRQPVALVHRRYLPVAGGGRPDALARWHLLPP